MLAALTTETQRLARLYERKLAALEALKKSLLLRLKYNNSIADAVADLGKPEEIGHVFAGFQKYLYRDVA